MEDTVLPALEREFQLFLSDGVRQQVRLYWRLLEKWNRRISLTAIGCWEEALRYHFFECLQGARLYSGLSPSWVDVGSGAGFPGLVWKIYRPSLRLTLIERNHKKAVFLEQVARELRLEIEVRSASAEDFGWEGAGMALLRAVRPSRRLLRIFSRQSVAAVCFHGQESPLKGIAIRTEAVPGSRNRFISHYRF